MHEGAQIILVDTPGIFAPRRRLDRAMVAAAWGGAQDADVALLVVDARAGLTDAGAAHRRGAGEIPPPGLARAQQDRPHPRRSACCR